MMADRSGAILFNTNLFVRHRGGLFWFLGLFLLLLRITKFLSFWEDARFLYSFCFLYVFFDVCGSLTLPGCLVPTRVAQSLSPTAVQRRENAMKTRELRMERDHSPINCHGQNRLNLGKLVQFITNQNQSRIMRIKTSPKNTFPPPLPLYQS